MLFDICNVKGRSVNVMTYTTLFDIHGRLLFLWVWLKGHTQLLCHMMVIVDSAIYSTSTSYCDYVGRYVEGSRHWYHCVFCSSFLSLESHDGSHTSSSICHLSGSLLIWIWLKTGRWIYVDIAILYVPPLYYGQLYWTNYLNLNLFWCLSILRIYHSRLVRSHWDNLIITPLSIKKHWRRILGYLRLWRCPYKHESALLSFGRAIHRSPVYSPPKMSVVWRVGLLLLVLGGCWAYGLVVIHVKSPDVLDINLWRYDIWQSYPISGFYAILLYYTIQCLCHDRFLLNISCKPIERHKHFLSNDETGS